jgi:type IV secretory pathway VirJ component
LERRRAKVFRLVAVFGVIVVVAFLSLGDSAGAERVTHGRFKDVPVFRPRGEVRHFAFLFSGDGGWSSGLSSIASMLAADGTFVVGIDTEKLYLNLDKDPGQCVFPDGDLENLSRFVQAYYRLPTYFTPVLIGHSAGASMVYAMLAQAPRGTFAGGVSLSFCVDLDLVKPLCKAEHLNYTEVPHEKGARLLPTPRLGAPWIAMHGDEDDVCSPKDAKAFVSQVGDARYVELPGVDHSYREGKDWIKQFKDAFATVAANASRSTPHPPETLSDLPIVEVPSEASSQPGGNGGNAGNRGTANDTFAVLLSGDGGWAGIDKEVASRLAASGIPVAGVDSLRYFWAPRTPEGLARDLDRIIQYYATQWHRSRALLIGYSQGADVLPFAFNRLSSKTRSLVKLTALVGISTTASFEFHVTHWLGGGDEGLPTAPELRKMAAPGTLCIYGDDDEDTVCPSVSAKNALTIKLSGGHHFGGDYGHLARLILDHSGSS